MSDDMIKVEVNGQQYPARKGEMLIQVTDREGITVPRFCYHEKLTVAANCRSRARRPAARIRRPGRRSGSRAGG